MKKPIIFVLALGICLTLTCIVCVAQEKGENRSSQLTVTGSKVRAMIARATPHIEAVTGRRFKAELKFRLVDRAFARDILEGEFELQMKKVLREMPVEKLDMIIENSAHASAMLILGKYSWRNKEFYLIPSNLYLQVTKLKIKDESLDDFLFLVITHEMVHALDDQYFDLGEKISHADNLEKSLAFNALMEGHAVYITTKVAERLNIPDVAQELSVKSAAGLIGVQTRMQQEVFHNIYEKGSQFVAALVKDGGNEAVGKAFQNPPYNTRQIFHPEEYLSPGYSINIAYPELFAVISKHLPVEGMEKQFIRMGEMTLKSVLSGYGVHEEEKNSIAATCLDGGMQTYVDAAGEEAYEVVVIMFQNTESLDRFNDIDEKITISEMKQINAMLNASYKLELEEELSVNGFDKVRYRKIRKIVDQKVTNEMGINANSGALHIAIQLTNPRSNIKKVALISLLEDILNGCVKQGIEVGTECTASGHPVPLKKTSESKSLTRAELEEAVNKLLQGDIVKLRPELDKVFDLALIYEEDGHSDKAIRLYQKGLQADATNLVYQLRLGRLLLQHGEKDQGVSKIRYVYELAEDSGLFRQAKDQLIELDTKLPKHSVRPDLDKNIEIVLVPVGNSNRQVLTELKFALQDRMGLVFRISDKVLELGEIDRKLSDYNIFNFFESITKELTKVQIDAILSELDITENDLGSLEYQKRFIYKYLAKIGLKGELAREQFDAYLEELGEKGQYFTPRLAKELKKTFPFDRSETVRGYLGVTSEVLYNHDCNFCFGSTDGAYGVISYYRFTASANDQSQNRPRLIKRLLKQALSSANFIIGIPRCNNPYCARAYYHSVAEQDAKSDELCHECAARLEAYKKNPVSYNSGVEYSNLGVKYLEEGDIGKAIGAYKLAIEHDPEFGAAYENLGYAYKQKGADDKAAAAYKKALQLVPDSESAHIYLGHYYLSKKKYQLASEQFSKLLKAKPESVAAHCGLAIAYRYLGQLDKAIVQLENAKNLDPHTARPHTLLGHYYKKQNKLEECIKAYDTALKIDPTLYHAHHNIGLALLEAGKKDGAVQHFRKAIEVNPSFFDSHCSLGRIYGESGLLDEALERFKAALDIQPDSADVLNNIGYTYYQKKMYKKAIDQYKKALKISPRHGLAHYNKALCHYANKQFDKAVKHFDKAIEYGYPGSPRFSAALLPYRK